MSLNPTAIAWLESRALDSETASRLGIYSAKRAQGGDPVPDAAGNILVFPYIDGGEEVNAKYRGRDTAGKKRFWQRAGARKTFFNVAVLDDPAVQNGQAPVVITEGELDTVAAVQSGHPFSVSVPDGAPPARDEQGNLVEVPDNADDVVPEHDDKYRYVFNNWDRLKRVKRFVLAVDNDEPGRRLGQELARRLGRSRCCLVSYPAEPCVADADGVLRPVKDLNEVLQHFGADAVMACIEQAKPFPVKGLYKLSDFPERPPLLALTTGFRELDHHMRLYRGAFVVVSGLPGGGKTALMTQIAMNMATGHNWRIAIASFEMHVRPILENMLLGFMLQKPRNLWTKPECDGCRRFIDEHFVFIALAPDDEDTEADVQWVIDRAADAVVREGISMLLLDPWNEVEHKRRPGENVADYTNRAIRLLKRFAHSYDVCTVVVAHPTKSAGLSVRSGEPMSLYDIADGATWANKAEIGLVIHRASPHDRIANVGIRKVKFHETGKIGDVSLMFDDELRQFVA
ncbi:DnaB-like helicase C-terminal domain-containing protein [Methylobacterium sp. WCS2018Hpa-22]|uniref:DnaB-like helicase C-terminal domain-containing protein n=1 Tax=Methylobacterium sp. WCS2018Hpa-22 TaxID=3073633 RepID=UPI002889DAB3|nr:DnaB-like helicase C-terminal domain-containing protein [Methylobacterium sp. WCS2018Hpa-22]